MRLNNPTPMTRMVMSAIFKDMIRTVCHQSLRIGKMRGTVAVVARFGERPDENELAAALEKLLQDKGVACGEVWSAASLGQLPVSEEERLRGGDRRIEACLMVETLRVQDADRIAGALSSQFPPATIGVYRLLCEISRSSDAIFLLEAPMPCVEILGAAIGMLMGVAAPAIALWHATACPPSIDFTNMRWRAGC